MKRILACLIVSLFVPSVLSAQPFVPNTLLLNPNHPHRAELSFDYNSDGVYIPVEVQGNSARTVLMIYTSGKGDEIGFSRHGYRGWHWINKVDTSIYIAPPVDLPPGDNPTSIFWDFRDKDGNKTAWAEEFNYYLFAYEHNTPKVPVVNRNHGDGALMGVFFNCNIDIMGEGGVPRDAPLIVSRNRRWVVGGDPADAVNFRTTSQTPSQNIAIDKHDENYFYATFNHDDSKSKHVRRYQFVENGESILDENWGIGDGETEGYTAIWEGSWGLYTGLLEHAGTASDMDYIYTAGNQRYAPVNYFHVLNYAGEVVKVLDMSDIYNEFFPIFVGFPSGGPAQIRMFDEFSSTKLLLNHHGYCWRVAVDPVRAINSGNEDDFLMWVNGNGDWFTDTHTPEMSDFSQWICNTVTSAPYTYQMTADANGVGIIQTAGLGYVTFALFGPDGTGAGYHALYGESDRWKYAAHFVKYDTQWDGLYTDGNSTHIPGPEDYTVMWGGQPSDNTPSGVWYTPANSFSGKLYAGSYQPVPKLTTSTPVFSPEPGIHSGPVEVTITCETEGAKIHYTVNGAIPCFTAPVYTGPILVTSTTTLKARSYNTGMYPSGIASVVYQITDTGIETPSSEPLEYSLGQNYPNPFNLSTTINYALPKSGRVVLRIYDVNGRLVRTLADSEFSAGYHQAVWDGHNDNGDIVGAGIYFLRMNSGDFRKTIRMLLLK